MILQKLLCLEGRPCPLKFCLGVIHFFGKYFLKAYQYAKYSDRHFSYVISSFFHNDSVKITHSHLADEETEMQRV